MKRLTQYITEFVKTGNIKSVSLADLKTGDNVYQAVVSNNKPIMYGGKEAVSVYKLTSDATVIDTSDPGAYPPEMKALEKDRIKKNFQHLIYFKVEQEGCALRMMGILTDNPKQVFIKSDVSDFSPNTFILWSTDRNIIDQELEKYL